MKIVIAKSEDNNNEIQNTKIFVDNILARILHLVKADNKLIIASKLKKIDEIEKDLINKDKNLSDLLIKSSDIKKDTKEKIMVLNSENSIIKKKVLEWMNGE